MSQTKHVKLLAAFAAVSMIANSVVGQNEPPRLPQQPGAQPGIQAPREGQQPRANTGQRGEARPGDQRIDRQDSSAELDRHLATWLAAENEAQVTLSQQVAENAQNDEVKQFAQQMVEHHQQITQRLREVVQADASEQPSRRAPTGQDQLNQNQLNQNQLNQNQLNQNQLNQNQLNQDRTNQVQPRSESPGQEQSRTELPFEQEPIPGLPVEEEPLPGVPGRDQPRPEVAGQAQPRAAQTAPRQSRPQQPGQERRENSAQPSQPSDQPARQDQNAGRDLTQAGEGNATIAWQLTAIKREVCQQNLKSAMEELQNKKGVEFDACYMQLQVFAHQGMVNTIKIFQHYASEELQSVLQEAGPNVETHLEEAKQLAKKLDSNDAEDEG